MSKEKQIEEMFNDVVEAEQRYHKYCLANICHACEYYGDGECDNHIRAEYLYNAGYRKQSENTIELPCKVGDAMYVTYKGIAYPVRVNAIRIDTKKNNHRICVSGTFHLYEDYDHNYKATFSFDSIGKSLFYTEAEAKMKGGAE